MSMFYIYDDTVAFEDTVDRGVVAYAFPRSERTANELMLNAKNRYAYVRSLPRPTGAASKRNNKSPVTMYAEGVPVDQESIQNLSVPSISFVFGSAANNYAVPKEKFDAFIKSLAEYKKVKEQRQLETDSMTYGDLVRYYVEFPLDKSVKDLLMTALSNLGTSSVGPDIETNVSNRQMMEGVYSVLRGYEESGDDSTIKDLIMLGSYDSTVDYTEAGD